MPRNEGGVGRYVMDDTGFAVTEYCMNEDCDFNVAGECMTYPEVDRKTYECMTCTTQDRTILDYDMVVEIK